MEIIRSTTDFPERLRGGALTIGNFDGVHLGHARIVERLTEFAKKVSGSAIVFTFEPHPVRLLRPDVAPPPLTWTERKAELLAELGVDALVAYPTNEKLLAKTPQEFFEEIICQLLSAKAVIEGPNFFFGRNRTGTVETLRQFCQQAGIAFDIVQPLQISGEMASSSRIRQLIAEGEVAEAAKMLTKPYRIRGIVTHGAGRGAKIGFPTANLEGIDTLIPADGIYAGWAIIADQCLPAAIHIGPNPTFGEQRQKTEVYILDYHGALYGQPLEVDFVSRLRGIVTFENAGELVSQMKKDVEQVRSILKT